MAIPLIDPSRVIPLARLPGTARLPDDIARRLASLTAGERMGPIDLPPPQAPKTGSDSLGPPLSGQPQWDNDVSHLRAEFRIDGKVVARVYDSGGVELADAYGALADMAGFGSAAEGTAVGPELGDIASSDSRSFSRRRPRTRPAQPLHCARAP